MHYTMHDDFDQEADDDDDIVYGDDMDFLVDCMEDVLDTLTDSDLGKKSARIFFFVLLRNMY